MFIAITARQVPKAEKLYDMYNEKFPENRKDLWEIKRMRTLTLEHNHLGNVEVEGKWAEKVKTRSEARDRRRYVYCLPIPYPSKGIDGSAWKKELDAQMYGDMLFGRTMEMPIVIKDQEDDTYQVITSKKRIDNLEGLMRELQADSDDEAGSAKIDMKSERKAQEQELAPKTSEES